MSGNPEPTGTLALEKIRIDGGTQMRADLNEAVVDEYAQIIRDGTDFPPVVVFFDGSKHWLGDGFHRLFGYRKAGALEIPAEIRRGTKRDAILFSVGANASHGLRRTNADKRKAVETLLADKEWSGWSDREIARRAGVGHPLVASIRVDLTGRNSSDERAYTTRHGTLATMDTANIGKSKLADSPPAVQDAADRAEQAAGRRAQQAEFDRQRDEHQAALPEHIREHMAAREGVIEARRQGEPDAASEGGGGLTPEQRIEELEENVHGLETEAATLRAENEKFGAMRVQFDAGGFEKVIAGKDEQIRVLMRQVETESADKASWARKAKFWEKEAKARGWKPDVATIDTKTGEVRHA